MFPPYAIFAEQFTGIPSDTDRAVFFDGRRRAGLVPVAAVAARVRTFHHAIPVNQLVRQRNDACSSSLTRRGLPWASMSGYSDGFQSTTADDPSALRQPVFLASEEAVRLFSLFRSLSGIPRANAWRVVSAALAAELISALVTLMRSDRPLVEYLAISASRVEPLGRLAIRCRAVSAF